MLVLTRKIGEEIVINNNITVKLLAIEGNKVRLGIVAPRDVKVDREEIAAKKRKQTKKENSLAMSGKVG